VTIKPALLPLRAGRFRPSHAADTGALSTKFYHMGNTALMVAAPLALAISPSPWVMPVSRWCWHDFFMKSQQQDVAM
jgi:hypothetical protein